MKKLIALLAVMTIGRAEAQWKFSGQTGPYFNALGIQSSTVTQAQKAGTFTEFKFDYKSQSPWKFKAEAVIRTDLVARDAQEFFQLMPKNFYLQRKYGSLQMKIGYQTITVDGPDVINPADIMNAKNWIDPTNPIAMGSPGLSLAQEIDEWNWELFYVPKQTTPILPGSHSPWLPRKNRLPIESENTTVLIPNNVEYQYLSPKSVHHPLDHNMTMKIQRKSENLETQLVYYNGLSMSPFLLTKIQGTLLSVNPDVISVDSPVRLQPLYYRQQAFAGTFLLPFESWAIKGGFNWLKPEGSDSRIPKETTLGVIGIEKSVETPIGLVTGIVDYIRQKRQDENQISFLRSVFEEAVSGGFRVPIGEEMTFLGGGLYDFRGHSQLLKASFYRRISPSWSMEVSGQSLQGSNETLLGLYKHYDSYGMKLIYAW